MITARRYRPGQAVPETFDPSGSEDLGRDDAAFDWIDIVDPQPGDLESLQGRIGLHPTTVEDMLHRRQRTKVEVFEAYVFIVLRPVTVPTKQPNQPHTPLAIDEHEVHLVAGEGFLVTLRWSPGYSLDGATARWERRQDLHDEGFALYAVLDEVVDDYLSAVEALEDEVDELEDAVFERDGSVRGDADVQERLFRLRRDTVMLRRAAMPLRHGIDMLQEEPFLTTPALAPYYRDVMDHLIRVVELADNVRELLTSLLEVRVAQGANRLNEVMKKLSAWAAIVLVPTLIAGVYGMNFRHMPELDWTLGYPLAIGMMVGSSTLLYVVFRRKDWL
ncbi:MAG TPA: magnesium/cobalt transporter CorA [Actinomycetota bacterium]|nr:magnesium/cobalt transporter CorA [Actinomycetota bacterium]